MEVLAVCSPQTGLWDINFLSRWRTSTRMIFIGCFKLSETLEKVDLPVVFEILAFARGEVRS